MVNFGAVIMNGFYMKVCMCCYDLKFDIENEKQVASDIVIYVDTSASQTGLYRKDTLVTLRRLLVNLNVEDRVH